MADEQFQIRFRGPLRVFAPDGSEITPKGSKARGLIALLADYPRVRRSRRWLEARLWSERNAKQASGSLRQALTEIRAAFGDWRDVLVSDRLDVWLDEARVVSDIDPDAAQAPSTRDLLEGLDIRDQEFEDWLRTLRQTVLGETDEPSESARAPVRVAEKQSGPMRLWCRTGENTSIIERVSAELMADQVGRNLEDVLGVARLSRQVGKADLDVITDITEDASKTVFVIRIVHVPSDSILFSGFRTLIDAKTDLVCEPLIAEFAHEAASRAIARLPFAADLDRDEVVAAGFAEIAKRRLFSYNQAELADADDLWSRAFDASPLGIHLSWRAFQRTTQVIEGLSDPTPELLEEAMALIVRAEETSPENAQVHAVSALVRLLLFDDIDGGLCSAEAGLRRNPNGLFVRQALALAAGTYGDTDTAYAMSQFCRPALKTEDARHLWDLYHGLVCLSMGRHEEAKQALETAARVCPNFRAPHRQLIALNTHLGAHESAARHLSILSQLEPEFTLDRLTHDLEYPVATLRRAGLIDAARLAEIS